MSYLYLKHILMRSNFTMLAKKFSFSVWVTLILLFCGGGLTGCSSTEATPTPTPGIRTWLLVKAPDSPLPINEPVNVKSRTEDSRGVSHVELYALQLPSGDTNVLIRSDRAPFDQTSFTASQIFVPIQKGHYVVQVIGYNRTGEKSESNIIGFDID
jgi:hypothetical protein